MANSVLMTETVFPDMEPESTVFADANVEPIVTEAGSPEEILDAAEGEDVDALLTATHIPITEAVFDGIDTLQIVSSYGIGVDHIDVEAATRHSVPITNVPDYGVEEVSSHAVSLLLACARSIPQYDGSVAEGQWDWEAERPLERLRGKTFGLIAFGKIARRVSEKVDGFDFDVITCDPHITESDAADYGVELVDFEELLERADLLSTHTPLTEETRHIVDRDAFQAMKDSAIFVNTSRGPVVDESALYDAIAGDEIAKAAIDVMEEEPPGDSPLLGLDDVIVTPHAAWYSEQSMEELQRKAAEEVVSAFEGRSLRYVVNDGTSAPWASGD